MTAVCCSPDKAHLLKVVSTMGAEKSAPPGMGRSPIKAGSTDPAVRSSPDSPAKPSTIRSIWRLSFIRRLMIRIEPTIRNKLMVWSCERLWSVLPITSPGASFIHKPSTREPIRRQRLNPRRNRLRMRIRPKTPSIFTRAGME